MTLTEAIKRFDHAAPLSVRLNQLDRIFDLFEQESKAQMAQLKRKRAARSWWKRIRA